MRIGLAAVAVGVWLLGCTGEAQPRPAGAAKNGVAVLELFTSQGCSSCPSADRLLSELGRESFDGTVIPLAYHVDYWNYLGWKDPFSFPGASARQREYARTLSAQVYTPQLVVNGTEQFVGSAAGAIRKEIGRQLEQGTGEAVILERAVRDGDRVTVGVRGPDGVVVVLFENGVVTQVSRGENAGKRLTNDFIVRAHARVPSGQTTVTLPLDRSWRTENLGVAAFVQDERTLAIHGGAVRMLGR
jgi:hypothetical protein